MVLKVLAILLSYTIGNFSTSIIVSKLWAGIDIRKYGSGNAGATNVLRTLGMKAGLVTFIGDALKAILAVWIGSRLGGEGTALICGIAVVIGHNWPIFLGFKGGKGIASSIGVGLFVNPIVAIICIIVGVLIVAKTKYVSLGSVVAISLLPVLLLFSGFKFFLFGLVLALMAIYRHKENISRLLKGTESKLGQKSRTK
ncbi:MAG: acyl-phosphate glycerol 3-phosphate acyltransferase [Anaerosolibacter sp.]|jgi:glycerol-3-phosphate acyltransferase PlsY|uniref:glycerol-3-phosphate 1-O-acyltransferase PlsY n=1 Tax=Anaerosolibacter sp. TaxID=1872527 RepID=UPI002628D0A4|nr:glycerol-3-phosphate 1-O-acyltransferase PlsY [Anaerosolibacter sp.]MDF2546869.1 acyl-phosphate glycerol 3-phosphate acyltransferase [Anaerosolibacter sp.]